MADEGQRPIANEVDGRLVPGQQEEDGIRYHFLMRVDTALLATGEHGEQVLTGSGQPFLNERREILHQPVDGFAGKPHTIRLPTTDEDELFGQLAQELTILVCSVRESSIR